MTINMIINGEAVESAETFDVINPSNGQAFDACAKGNATHVNKAVRAARAAFPTWSAKPIIERREYCQKLAAVLEENAAELSQLIARETGKPVNGLNGVGAGMEIGGAIGWTHVTAALDLPVEVLQDNDEARVEVHYKPVGVVASITPWNWPLMIAIWHVVPAMLAGNTVVIKPSENTPAATSRFVELANAVLPQGVLNLVNGAGDVGAALAEHEGVEKVVFTGSTATGRRIMSGAAATLKRLTLELGGNDAGIVLPDVDVKEIAAKLFGVSFHNNGQTCAALKRLYVHESIHDALCDEMAKVAKSVIVGDALDEATQLGPLQNKDQRDIVSRLADDARGEGGKFLCGGEAMEGPGYFYKPTIVAGLRNGHSLVDKEQFGPILPIIKYSETSEALAAANDCPNGLGGSVWSKDISAATEIAKQLECGSAWVNDHGAIQPDAPFGGVKQSGIGVEFGEKGLKEFTTVQTVKIAK